MKNLFVITASSPEARQHVVRTIEKPIRVDKVERHFAGSELSEVKNLGLKHGYYAWGAMPGPRNVPTWDKMQIGDHILVYQNGSYTYYTRVIFKAHNREFALDNWGPDEDGKTWEYMYLLERPLTLTTPVEASVLAEYLHASYRGFTQISPERISRIMSDYGSLDAYLAQFFRDSRIKEPEPVEPNPMLDLAIGKKQVILYGPPGTGKTYVARKIAVRFLEPHSGSRSSVLPPPSEQEPANSWIFQANPNRYDILGALSDPECEETMWSVNQHRDNIRNGDTAFIWMSGPSAGIYAVADITSDPRMVSGDAEDDRYWRSSADVGAPRLVVGIRITRNLVSAPILKSELLGIPQLRDLEILRFAQATNFAVTQTQRAEILKLVESRSMA